MNYSLIVNLKIDTSFVDIRTLREDISILKAQICLHLETRAFRFWPTLQMSCFGESPQGQTQRRNSEQGPVCLGAHLNGNVKKLKTDKFVNEFNHQGISFFSQD